MADVALAPTANAESRFCSSALSHEGHAGDCPARVRILELVAAGAAFVFKKRHKVFYMPRCHVSPPGRSPQRHRSHWCRASSSGRSRSACCRPSWRLSAISSSRSIRPEQFPSAFGSMRAFWDPFTRYDGGWYYQIARNGYQFVVGGPSVGVGKPGKIAYFPVYPLLMRYVGRLFGHTPSAVYFGGIVVSWVAFVRAMVLLLRLCHAGRGRRPGGASRLPRGDLSVCVLLRRRLHGGDVPAVRAGGVLRVSPAVVDRRRRVRRAGDRHASTGF